MGGGLHSVQIAWGYFLAFALLVAAYGWWRGRPVSEVMRTPRWPLQLLRSSMLVLTITTLFLSLVYIPLVEALAIAFMSPLIVVALSGPMLGERVDLRRWCAVGVGVCGMLVLMPVQASGLQWGSGLALASAAFFALFQILTRRLAATENSFTTLVYTGLGGLLWTSLAVGFVWQPLTIDHAMIFAFIGVLGVLAHFCVIQAFSLAEASVLAPFNYFKLLWGVALGYFVFQELPALHVVTGGSIIVLGGLYAFYAQKPHANAKTLRRR